MIDIVIIADSKSEHLTTLTAQTINTARQTTGDCNIIVVESCRDVKYAGCEMIYPEVTFNYNAYLNIGARAGQASHIAFCNNDLLFHPNWWGNMLNAMTVTRCESASPLCPDHHPREHRLNAKAGVLRGHDAGKHVTGWCIVMTRNLWNRIGGFDECVNFWCSENVFVEQLKKAYASHVLVLNSVVTHVRSQTLSTLQGHEYDELTVSQVKKYNRLFKKNLFGWGN